MGRRRVEGWFSLAVLLLVVGLAFLAQGLREEPEAHEHSVASTEDSGRRGFYLLLQELGWSPREWRRAPGELPRGEHLLFCPDTPSPWKPRAETQLPGEQPNLLPSHGLENYRAFVEQGGTLVATYSGRMQDFLRGELGLEGAEGLAYSDAGKDDGELETRRLRLQSGEVLEVELDPAMTLRALPAGSPGRELWIVENAEGESGAEKLAAVEFPLGAGRVVLLAGDAFLDNSDIRAAQNGLAGVRLVEELARGGDVLFDEYCLGSFEPPSTLALGASPRVFLLGAHALALLALFVWGLGYARAFPRDPAPRERASPLERAESLARVWRSSGRTQLAARALRRRIESRSRGRRAGPAELAALERLALELEDRKARR